MTYEDNASYDSTPFCIAMSNHDFFLSDLLGQIELQKSRLWERYHIPIMKGYKNSMSSQLWLYCITVIMAISYGVATVSRID